MMDDTSNTNPTTRRLEDPVPCTPLTRAQQVAARGEAGVIGLFLGLLVFVLLLILGITGEKPMFILSGGVSGGLIGIGILATGLPLLLRRDCTPADPATGGRDDAYDRNLLR